MLEVSGLVAEYGPVRALHEVDLTVERGSITAVLGANGAGKTTLLRALSGLLRPKAGAVRLNDQTSPAAARRTWCGWAWRTCPRGAG